LEVLREKDVVGSVGVAVFFPALTMIETVEHQ